MFPPHLLISYILQFVHAFSRAGFVHGDLLTDNIVWDDESETVGIIDYSDVVALTEDETHAEEAVFSYAIAPGTCVTSALPCRINLSSRVLGRQGNGYHGCVGCWLPLVSCRA